MVSVIIYAGISLTQIILLSHPQPLLHGQMSQRNYYYKCPKQKQTNKQKPEK